DKENQQAAPPAPLRVNFATRHCPRTATTHRWIRQGDKSSNCILGYGKGLLQVKCADGKVVLWLRRNSNALTVRRPSMGDKEPQQGLALRLCCGREITLATLPIHEAAREGNAAGVREALEAGNPVDSHDAEGYTPLMIAAQNGFLPLFEFLLSAGADPYDGFEELQTALTLAVYSEQIDIVRAWVARRLEVNGGGKMFL